MMRPIVALAALSLLAACVRTAATENEPQPSSRYTFWRPAPVEGAPDPAAVIAGSAAADWRAIDPDNLLVMDLAEGRVVIELAPDFAPVHVANIRRYARAGSWSAASIYRVQENYVTQWGNGDSEVPVPEGVVELPPAEYERPLAGLSVRPLGFPDSYAPMAGHANGWPVAYDPERGEAWLPHCFGTVGVARGLHPDTGSGAELYTIIGHAPRALDRNIATVGRVIEGMGLLSARPRGTGNLGFYSADAGETPIPIRAVRLAADMPAAERPQFEVMRTESDAYTSYVTGLANRGGEFFRRPAGGLDLCNARVPVRRKPA